MQLQSNLNFSYFNKVIRTILCEKSSEKVEFSGMKMAYFYPNEER